MQGSFAIALEEFIHVGGALVVIIAAVSVLTGIMREYIPQQKLQQKLAKHEKMGSFLGASFGILTPFCSASVVPVSMGMAEMGVSMGIIFSFLISAPLCNFVVTGMILAVFGWKVTLIYFAITFSSAVISGFLMARSPLRNEIKRGAELVQGKKQAATCGSGCAAEASPPVTGCCAEPAVITQECSSDAGSCSATGCCGVATVSATNHKEKLLHGLSFSWALFKHIIPYVLIGSVISALSAAFLPAEIVEKYVGGNSWYSVPIAAIIGVPLYLRIELAIPLLKVLIAKGMGMGAAMALVIGGTGASLPEIALISSVLKPKAVIAFVSTVMLAAILGGIIFQIIL
jgi:uncharacterized membrane protein YraQ (UPF0718 family)